MGECEVHQVLERVSLCVRFFFPAFRFRAKTLLLHMTKKSELRVFLIILFN